MQGNDLVGDGWSCDLVYHDVQALRRGGDVTLECTPRKVRAGGSGHLSIYGSRIEGYMSIYGNNALVNAALTAPECLKWRSSGFDMASKQRISFEIALKSHNQRCNDVEMALK